MFLIIWRGWGILVPVIAVLVWFVPLAVVESVLGHSTYTHYSRIFSPAFALLAAGAIWVAGRTVNGVPGRVLVDPANGQRVVLRKHHDLFFVPMQWWAIPVAVLGIASVFVAS